MSFLKSWKKLLGINIDWEGWWKKKKVWLAILCLVAGIALAVLILLFWGQVQRLGTYGYMGAFILGFLQSAIIILPLPAIVITFALGGVLNPLFVGIATGTGEMVGALTLYYAGRGGLVVFGETGKQQNYLRIQTWMKKRGTLVLFILSAVLNPFFYPAGIAAGALKFPLWRYVLSIWLGKVIKGTVIAGAGALGLRWFLGG
ncbi:MAG: VTT domain-containing protein [Dehalococcoidia bacterium]|nr:VTT domain-containing protein [Dehalococcoidia bacterium]